MQKTLFLIIVVFMSAFLGAKEPIVTAEKFLEYKRAFEHVSDFKAPEIVLICYQSSTMRYLLEKYPECQPSKAVSHFYTLDNGRVGILGDLGIGAPGLALKMEELVILGTKRFMAVGTAGSLMNEHQIGDFIVCPKALAEDGVAHLYLLQDQHSIAADQKLLSEWACFAKDHSLPQFQPAMTWSFSAFFRETVEDVYRVRNLGCSVVEMEAATLYAIGQEKRVQRLSLFVISDSINEKAWTPRFKEPAVKNNLHQLAEWVLEFCMADALTQQKSITPVSLGVAHSF